MAVTAYANTNIALIKYWGKRAGASPALNLPAVGSLSLTLDGFGTETTVALRDAHDASVDDNADVFVLNGVRQGALEAKKVTAFVDLVRARTGRSERVVVTSRNDVPTAAGLASSASAFAALALSASRAFGLELSSQALSSLARQGSGSAARSIYGGFVVLHRGVRDDGVDCVAEAVDDAGAEAVGAFADTLRLVVVRCAEGPKATKSTAGMDHTALTSPYFAAWVDTHQADLDEAQAALRSGDLEKLGEVMEHSTLKMHATTLAARPGFFYFEPTTIAVLREVQALRRSGIGAWATMDAGPHVKVLCRAVDAAAVSAAVSATVGVVGVDVCGPGKAARVLP
jgi:diphosphomevalonate decarboxylase